MHNFRCIYRISVIGLTTDNRSNLVAALKLIETVVISNKTALPLTMLVCAAHTGQLLIADFHISNHTKICGFQHSIYIACLAQLNAPTRINCIYICCQDFMQNYDSIVNIIHFFNEKKWSSPIIRFN